MFCMSKFPGANFACEFRRKRNAKPISFSAKRNFGLRAKSVRSSKLYLLDGLRSGNEGEERSRKRAGAGAALGTYRPVPAFSRLILL